jgi:hypothetical protein
VSNNALLCLLLQSVDACTPVRAHPPPLFNRSEERFCRFCRSELPDWREVHASLPKATPVMSVVHNGSMHQVSVEQGTGGQEQFRAKIREIFGLADDDAIHLTFGCKVPCPCGDAGQEKRAEERKKDACV